MVDLELLVVDGGERGRAGAVPYERREVWIVEHHGLRWDPHALPRLAPDGLDEVTGPAVDVARPGSAADQVYRGLGRDADRLRGGWGDEYLVSVDAVRTAAAGELRGAPRRGDVVGLGDHIVVHGVLDERLGQAEHGEEKDGENDLDAGAAAEDAAGLEREVLLDQREELRG